MRIHRIFNLTAKAKKCQQINRATLNLRCHLKFLVPARQLTRQMVLDVGCKILKLQSLEEKPQEI